MALCALLRSVAGPRARPEVRQKTVLGMGRGNPGGEPVTRGRRCVRGWRRSHPGIVLDLLLELGDELGGEGTPRLADGVQDVARGHLLLAALEEHALEHQL